jgi:PAS domain S-box-containing protein
MEHLRSNSFEEKNTQINSLPFSIQMLKGPNHIYTYVNVEACGLLNRNKSEIIGKSVRDIFPNGEEMIAILDRVYTTGKEHIDSKLPVVSPVRDQALQNYTCIYQPLWETNNGAISGVIITTYMFSSEITTPSPLATSQDTALQRLQSASTEDMVLELMQKNELVETILDSSGELIAAYDRETRFLAFNRTCEETYGVKKKDVLGKKLLDVFPSSSGSQMYHDLIQALAGNTIRSHEVMSTVTKRYYETLFVPLLDKNKQTYAVLVTAHDVTDHMETQHEIKTANEKLTKMNEDLLQFAFIASHDLQEPLRKIQIFSGRLRDTQGDKLDESGLVYVNKIIKVSQRMSELVSGLLAYSRTSRDKNQFQKVDLNEILNNVLYDFELMISQKHAVVDCFDLPQIDAIPLQIQQMFFNIISNSLKFISNREPHIAIKCTPLLAEEVYTFNLSKDQEYVKISVADNGIGFKQEYADQIFNLFYRLNGKSEFEGSGIGLSICKKIVNNHHGAIYATSSEGKGTTIHVILPIQQVDKE